MNSLVIFSDERRNDSLVVIEGERARELYTRYKTLQGREIRVAIFGGSKGIARVLEVASSEMRLEIVTMRESIPLQPIDLIVGLSRPQTTKKIIQAAVMIGVRSVHFVRTERGEKSYSTATLLKPRELQEELVKAMEQIGEGLAPSISVHPTFSLFCRHHLEKMATIDTVRLIAHPDCDGLAGMSGVAESRAVILAVGPEAGWVERELTIFERAGFHRVGLGARVLRVEMALIFLLGQISLLRAGSETPDA